MFLKEKTYLNKQLRICRIYTVSLFGLPPWTHLYQAPSVSSAGQTLTDTGDRKLLLHAYSVPPDATTSIVRGLLFFITISIFFNFVTT